ncbi:hypothetical protein GCM10009021_04280 [Halarchaeum nitratireducens]|uniref:Uncharacterized protein n=1 Tax=Halarchaeum nitratireducens TaxID=489913 RepID=A0A830G717_9EURY|nr:hypothetical protein GCM10009021_04280 [Halarchaeum nitratireducens]
MESRHDDHVPTPVDPLLAHMCDFAGPHSETASDETDEPGFVSSLTVERTGALEEKLELTVAKRIFA